MISFIACDTLYSLTDLFNDIADAIRGLKGTSSTIQALNFPSEISAISVQSALNKNGATVTAPAGYYRSDTSATVDSMTLPTSTAAAATSGYISKATVSRSTADQYINIPTGYNATGAYYKISAVPNMTLPTSAAASATSGYTSKATIAPSTSDQYLNIPTGYNTTASYYKISKMTSGVLAASGTGSATITVAPGTVSIAANTTAVSGKTRVALTPSTATTGISKYYAAFKATAAANSNGQTGDITGTATASVSTAGYVGTSTTGTGSVTGTATATTSAKDSSVYYTPLATAALTVTGSGTAGAPTVANVSAAVSGKTQVTVSPSTATSGISKYYAAVKATVGDTTITQTKSGLSAGWLGADSEVSAGGTVTGNNSTYYVPLTSAALDITYAATATSPTIANKSASVSGKTQITASPSTATSGISTYYMAVNATAPATTLTRTNGTLTAGWLGDVTQISSSAATTEKTGSTYYIPLASAALAVTYSGTATSPTIAKQSVPSGVTDAASGAATSTAPSSGVYVAVNATAPATTLTRSNGTLTAGWLGATSQITGSAATTGATGNTYYVPITTANPAFDGGAISGSVNSITGSNAVLSDTNNGISVTAAASASRAAVLYNGAVAGWVSKADNATALAASSSATSLTSKTRYIVAITVPKDKAFELTTTADTALDTTSDVTITNNAYRQIKLTNNANGNTAVGNGGTTSVTSISSSSGTVNINAYNNASTPALTGVQNIVSGGKWVYANFLTTYSSSGVTISSNGTGIVFGGTTIDTISNGSVTINTYEFSNTPNISVSADGLITVGVNNWAQGEVLSATVTPGYVSSVANGILKTKIYNTKQLTTQAATTYNTSTSNQTISSGRYITGTQTIRAVTTSNISPENIKAGVTITVGDSASAGRIKNVTGTYTGPSRPAGKFDCVHFYSDTSFTLKTGSGTTNWDGTMWYSTDGSTWYTWNGSTITSILSNAEYHIYLRGTGNHFLSRQQTNNETAGRFVLSGGGTYGVDSEGDLDALLDYTIASNGGYPERYAYWAAWLFCQSTIASAPALSCPTLTDHCYYGMFTQCYKLYSPPELPATHLESYCYANMFTYCNNTNFTPPALPATVLASYCYYNMFTNAKIETAPTLSATRMLPYCYANMFQGCTALTTAPSLPATVLSLNCYANMFQGCTSLTSAPTLPASTLTQSCYSYMFYNCTALQIPPSLNNGTTLASNCYYSMFQGCTALSKLPILPAATLPSYCYQNMFSGCTNIKLSTTRTGAYVNMYRIPYSATGTTSGSGQLTNMFTNTGGTFTGTPTINTTYYATNGTV